MESLISSQSWRLGVMRAVRRVLSTSTSTGTSSPSDPRYIKHADPRLLAALQQYGLDSTYPEVTYHNNEPVLQTSPISFKLDFYKRVEKGYEKMNKMLADGLLDSALAEENEIITIKGIDDNSIDLHVCRPMKPSSTSVCILHIHGGGMSILSTTDPIYRAFRLRLAELGHTVVGVEFRNVAGKLGCHGFPAGLNDCMSSLEFVHDNLKKFNASKILLLGESGGANLSISLALLARQRNQQSWISGVYGLCPYIYGDYDFTAKKKGQYPQSLQDNDGLLLPRCQEMKGMAMLYLPWGQSPSNNHLAWPYHAPLSALVGLPPFVISVNELDPCRDEALLFAEKLKEAEVSVRSRIVKGTCHAGELLFMKHIPDIFQETLQDINEFTKTLS